MGTSIIQLIMDEDKETRAYPIVFTKRDIEKKRYSGRFYSFREICGNLVKIIFNIFLRIRSIFYVKGGEYKIVHKERQSYINSKGNMVYLRKGKSLLSPNIGLEILVDKTID